MSADDSIFARAGARISRLFGGKPKKAAPAPEPARAKFAIRRRRAVSYRIPSEMMLESFTIRNGIAVPEVGMSFGMMYTLFSSSDDLRSIIEAILEEIWRDDLEVYMEREATPTDPEANQRLKDFLVKANRLGQPLAAICRQYTSDLKVADDGWIYVVKDYTFAQGRPIADQEPLGFEVKEVFRGHPAVMRWSVDPNTSEIGGMYVRCPVHHLEWTQKQTEARSYCPECQRPMLPVVAVMLKQETQTDIDRCFIEGEVYHQSECVGADDNTLYGESRLLTARSVIEILMAIQNYDWASFHNKKMPDGLVFWSTPNPEGAYAKWGEWLQKIKLKQQKNDPFVPMIAGESTGKNGGISYINLMGQAYEFSQAKAEFYRRKLAAFYRVPNLETGDTAGIGGLNAEREQTDMFHDAANITRKLIRGGLFKWLAEQIAPGSPYTYVQRSPELKDEIQAANLLKIELDAARIALGMAAHVEIKKGHVVISDGILQMPIENPLIPNNNPALQPATDSEGILSNRAQITKISPAAPILYHNIFEHNGHDAPVTVNSARRKYAGQRNLEEIISKMGAELAAPFVEEYLGVVARLKTLPPEQFTQELADRMFSEATARAANKLLRKDLAPGTESEVRRLRDEAMRAGYGQAQGSISSEIPMWSAFNLPAQEIIARDPHRTENLLSDRLWLAETQKEFQNLIAKEFSRDVINYNALVEDLQAKAVSHPLWHFERIARTELHRYADEGSRMAHASDPKIGLSRFHWMTFGDNRVRRQHRQWEAESKDGVPMSTIDGYLAERGINCRCSFGFMGYADEPETFEPAEARPPGYVDQEVVPLANI